MLSLLMQRITVYILLLCIIVQSNYAGIVGIYYQLNKRYIAQNLCNNKDKPILKCDGKCHLKAMLDRPNLQTAEEVPSPDKAPMPNLMESAEDLLLYVNQYTTYGIESTFYFYLSTSTRTWLNVENYLYQSIHLIWTPPD